MEVPEDHRIGPDQDQEDLTTEVLLVLGVADPVPDQDLAMAGSKVLGTEDQVDLRAGGDTAQDQTQGNYFAFSVNNCYIHIHYIRHT